MLALPLHPFSDTPSERAHAIYLRTLLTSLLLLSLEIPVMAALPIPPDMLDLNYLPQQYILPG
jgi:hypothetical protein